uniref:Uncharacterized protein n=1 Tax=Panagrolaimus sp. JU765 TaxID=591449 RepID=A0AC34RNT4_9BILA
MKLLVFVGLCMIFVMINGYERFKYGIDPVAKTCFFKNTEDVTAENWYKDGAKYTNWVTRCPYENRLTVECKNGTINPNATIQIYDFDDWFMGDDLLARFNWTKIADDGKSAYIDALVGTQHLSDHFLGDFEVELFWWFGNPCSTGNNYNEGDMFKQKLVFE